MESKDCRALEKYLDEWKKEHVYIGITGRSCVGKSLYINTMLGLKSGEQGAAEVGVGDTTREPKEYQHPDNSNVRFWDLPGFGTQDFSESTHLKRIEIERYDFFLIMYCTTIEKVDIQIIKELISKDKHFALVRTKFDEVVKDRKKSVKEWIDKVHEKGMTELRKAKIKTDSVKLFAISNTDLNVGEYGTLYEYIVSSLSEFKKTSILASVKFQTENIIDEKEAMLIARALKVSLAMGVVTGLPIPGIDVALNVDKLKKEIKFYMETFYLNEEKLKKLPPEFKKRLHLSLEILQSGLKEFICEKAALLVTMAIAEGAIESCLPVIGSLITGTGSFVVSFKFLFWVIKELAKDAKVIILAEIETML